MISGPHALRDRAAHKKKLLSHDIIDPMDLPDIYRMFQPRPVKYTLFSATQGISSKIGRLLEYKSFNQLRKTAAVPCLYLVTMG